MAAGNCTLELFEQLHTNWRVFGRFWEALGIIWRFLEVFGFWERCGALGEPRRCSEDALVFGNHYETGLVFVERLSVELWRKESLFSGHFDVTAHFDVKMEPQR